MTDKPLTDYEKQKRHEAHVEGLKAGRSGGRSSSQGASDSGAGVGFFTNNEDTAGRRKAFVDGVREGEREAALQKKR